MLKIKRLSLFIAVLGTEAWFLLPASGWHFEWEPALAFVASTFAFLFFERNLFATKNTEEADILLLKQLHEPFSSNSSLVFFKNHDFGGSFLDEYTMPLENFINNFTDYDHKFNNLVLEKKKQTALTTAKRLRSLLAGHTFFITPHARKMYPEHDPDTKRKERDETNNAATDFYDSYSDFIQDAQNILNVRLLGTQS